MATFANYNDMGKVLAGVLKALPLERPTWLQSFFTQAVPTNNKTVNFDVEYGAKNVMGQFVSPMEDASPIKLPSYSHKEWSFAYAKEPIDDSSYEELQERQMGDAFGQVDIERNKAQRLTQKITLAEQALEALFEKTAASLILYGGYVATSDYHPTMVYSFERTALTTAAQIKGSDKLRIAPSVNLTASAVTSPWGTTLMPVIATDGGAPSYTQGEKIWTKALVTAGTATPVKDVTLMVQTCNMRTRAGAVHMSDDAYEVFEFDVTSNYADAADKMTGIENSQYLKVTPTLEINKGLTYRRSWNFGNGLILPIYSYNAVYTDRSTGTETPFIGSGWVNVIPASGGIKVHGRIIHPDARYQAMPRYLHSWKDEKYGLVNYEYHTSFLMGHTDIDAVVSWKVI